MEVHDQKTLIKNTNSIKIDQKTDFLPEKKNPSFPTTPLQLGGVNINPDYPIETLERMYTWSENYNFPTWEECTAVKERADNLPDLLHIPFEI